jgi:hypothetical protein
LTVHQYARVWMESYRSCETWLLNLYHLAESIETGNIQKKNFC